MNTFKTNYKTVIQVTEEGSSAFKLDLRQNSSKIKAILLNRIGIDGTAVGEVLEYANTIKEIKQASYSSESEMIMDLYWTINKALITDYSGNNVLGSLGISFGKVLTNDNFKVILINIDLIK